MGSTEVVEVFPDLEFLLQINIVSIGEQLIEFLLISQMGSFDFTVETWCPWSDINMPNAYVGQVPVKHGLELMTVVGSDRVNAKGKAFNNMVDELNGGRLSVAGIDFQCTDAGGIVNRRILEPSDLLSGLVFERQELHVHLDVMSGNLFLVTMCLDRTDLRIAWQSIQTVAS